MSQPGTEELRQIRDQLQEEIREARGTLKDLRYEIKTARDLTATTHQLVTELAETQVRDLLAAEVTRQVTALGEETGKQMSKSTAKVIAEFDRLRDLLLGREHVADGREERSIPELLQDPAILARAQHAARRNAAEADRE
ncbi:hypothetical protein [Streptomyces sp. NBC_00986]|uniref:hypothetical protein n=1 Tax=Streptomyces sp. NBC_00986 TaxID=2903702 RepID=UPI003866E478|nr:hypothetical protein OG504_45215 [Streptomyces sp. NBC_00986]